MEKGLVQKGLDYLRKVGTKILSQTKIMINLRKIN